jgi:spoIIIJ-associated protein
MDVVHSGPAVRADRPATTAGPSGSAARSREHRSIIDFQEDRTVESTTDEPLDLSETSSDGDAVEVAPESAEPQVTDPQVTDPQVTDPQVTDAQVTDAAGLASDDDEPPADLLEREGEAAADYLEGLLDIIDADGDIDMDVEGDRAVVSVIGDRLRHLVGPNGTVLDALQELTRLAVARETGVRSRLMLDIGGHRARRRTELTHIGTKAAEEAKATGQPVTLAAMTAFERKVVHDAVAAAGQLSESEGMEPERRVVVLPASSPAAGAALEDPALDQA